MRQQLYCCQIATLYEEIIFLGQCNGLKDAGCMDLCFVHSLLEATRVYLLEWKWKDELPLNANLGQIKSLHFIKHGWVV